MPCGARCSLSTEPVGARAAVERLAVAVALLVALGAAVSDQRFLPGEVGLLEAVNDLAPWLGWPLRVVMVLGTLLAGLAVVALTAAWTRRQGARPAVAVLLAVAVAYRLDNVLKNLIARPRPPQVLAGLHVRETVGGFGFPSGHTTMAFALAASLHATVAPRWRWVVWVLAVTAGSARMYMGVHWPADVVGGAALGTGIGTGAWLLVAGPAGARRAVRASEAGQ